MLYGSSVVGRHPAAPAARHRQDDHGGLFCAGPGRDPPFPCVSLARACGRRATVHTDMNSTPPRERRLALMRRGETGLSWTTQDPDFVLEFRRKSGLFYILFFGFCVFYGPKRV